MSQPNKKAIEEKLLEALVTKELAPFVDSIKKLDKSSSRYKMVKRDYAVFSKRYEDALEVMKVIIDAEIAIRSTETLKDTVNSMFSYMGIVETLGNTIVDFVVMLLVANGIDFHIESMHGTPRVRHASSTESLETERVPLVAKLNFLRENDICTLASQFDSKLRNDIAHLNFVLKDDNICFKGKRGLKPVQDAVRVTSARLFTAINAALESIELLAEEEGWKNSG